jgi:DNA-binding transcriptional ArsR family regulator
MTYGLDKIEALGQPTRRAIFERLARGAQSVGALAEGMPVSRPAVSQHLKALKDAGLVVESRKGTSRIYCVDPTGLAEIRDYFDRFWDVALDSYRRSLEGGDA